MLEVTALSYNLRGIEEVLACEGSLDELEKTFKRGKEFPSKQP